MLTFFVFNQKYSFCTNLIQHVKIISLSWHLVASLIRISRIQWCHSVFSFLTSNTLFWPNMVRKTKVISLSLNLVPRLIRIRRIQWWRSLFLFLHGNTLLGQSWSRKSNYQFNLKFHRYLLLRLKFRLPKGASLHKSFMGNCPKISHMF